MRFHSEAVSEALREIALSPSTTQQIEVVAERSEPSTTPVEIAANIAPYLPVEAHRGLARFRDPTSEGALLFHGVGPGPMPSGAVCHSDLSIASALLYAFVSLAATPTAVRGEWDGGPLTDVKVTPGLELTASSKGTKALPLHQEDQHLMMPPDGLALLMVTGGSPIHIASMVDIVSDMYDRNEHWALETLRRPEFIHPAPLSFGGAAEVSRRAPVLCGPEGMPEIKVDLATTMATTESGHNALVALTSSVDQVTSEVHMVPGDLLLLDNRRWLHGRAALDENDASRWLIRCLLVFDSWRVQRDGPILDARGVTVAA